ncbi:MAG: translation initiation factor 2 [Blautia sp.]|nr:translation initiation factor 2 [Blautia sp.]
MKGQYHVIVQNNRVKYEFDIRRNITIIKGDSATGKTTLVSLIETYDRLGSDSGIEVVCTRRCLTVNNSNWEAVLDRSSDSIVFIDEENTIIKSKDFAKKIQGTSNYYVIVTRENLPNLPYSVEEIYGIHNSGRYSDLRKTYNSFYRLYGSPFSGYDRKVQKIIAEDSNAGYEFFKSAACTDINVFSAGGKTKIRRMLVEDPDSTVLIIADGAAFGSEISEIYMFMRSHSGVHLYLPESFEWILLSSGLIDGNRIKEILEKTEDYVDSSQYFSWEQFYTKLLVEETKNTYLQYSKSKLNIVYLDNRQKTAILHVFHIIWEMMGIS